MLKNDRSNVENMVVANKIFIEKLKKETTPLQKSGSDIFGSRENKLVVNKVVDYKNKIKDQAESIIDKKLRVRK